MLTLLCWDCQSSLMNSSVTCAGGALRGVIRGRFEARAVSAGDLASLGQRQARDAGRVGIGDAQPA
jgi:hypothetical protein